MVADGTTFTAVVTAVGPGYVPGGGTVVTAGVAVEADWTLVASALCDAPGYAPGTFGPAVFSESFDGGVIPPGWTVQTNPGEDWKVVTGADPLRAPRGESNGRLRAVRDRERHLRLFRRYVPRHAADRPVVQRERGHPLGQRLHRRRLGRYGRSGASRSTAARPGRASGGPRGAPRVPARSPRTCRSRRGTPTSRRDSTTARSSACGGRSTTSRSAPSPAPACRAAWWSEASATPTRASG